MTSNGAAPVWFITGCSSGFGRALGKAVLDRGWNAVLTARDPSSLEGLADGAQDRLAALRLDVDQGDQIAVAVRAAEARFGRIDVLVNNAGYGYNSTVEEADVAQVRALFETNFFGVFRLTQAVLPIMRRQGGGHIFNMGSLAGVFGAPSGGFYSATKHAIEGFTDALAGECAQIGVKVTVVEAGAFVTDFFGRSLKSTPTSIAAYQDAALKSLAPLRDLVKDRRYGDPARGAQAIIAAFLSDNPPLRLPLGMEACTLIEAVLKRRVADLDAWREVANSAATPVN